MVEIRKVGLAQEPPLHSNHVIIHETPISTFTVSGNSREGARPDHLFLPPFDSLQLAIEAACEWAETHGIAVVHINIGGMQ